MSVPRGGIAAADIIGYSSYMYELPSPKNTVEKDWHSADVIAELRKAGWSLRRLAVHHGYASPTTLSAALYRPWPKGERIIAEAIGVHPADIWPERHRQRTETFRAMKDRDDDATPMPVLSSGGRS